MRLDSYLVETGFFKSLGRSKRAVEEGKVKLNGAVCMKPSKNITIGDTVEVEEGMDMPRGYFKIKSIHERFPLFEEGDHVLDLGSSAGGFLMFAGEQIGTSGHIHGIEFSKDFRTELGKLAFENENISVMFADVFTVPLENVATEETSENGLFDILLNDMTLEPADSVSALSRMSPLLKEGGRLLQVIKIPKNRSKSAVLRKIEEIGYAVEEVIEPDRQEIYIIARKKTAGGFFGAAYTDDDGVEYDLSEELGTDGIDITDMVFEGEED
ncbi:MAG: methyltransferase domain-containing protein [Methanosarcinales archaeon]|jgi:23S rRNA (cytidine1920-2'-O)/16S rRNA (cytidine1409-2'-O)-methyltransferase|nr:methyltransferase domain-containing protein [Methanosarcinales archaeon]